MTSDRSRSPTISGGRIVLLVVGSVIALFGLAMAIGGGALLWLHQTQRDADGYFTTTTERFASTGFAVTSDTIDLGADDQDVGWASNLGDLARLRVSARSADPQVPVFVGIGPRDSVRAYLRGVSRSQVRDVDFAPFRVRYDEISGTRRPAPPALQGFWLVRAGGSGRQVIDWDVAGGQWMLVVMNATTGGPVATDMSFGLRIGALKAIAITLLCVGLGLLAAGVTMLLLGALRSSRDGPAAPEVVGLEIDEGRERQ